jgi:integrase
MAHPGVPQRARVPQAAAAPGQLGRTVTVGQETIMPNPLESARQNVQQEAADAIPSKRFARTLVPFLTRPEVDALLAAPDRSTWSGRRDHAFLLVAVQTGLRLSEMTGLKREDIVLGIGAHVRVIGKGRKERCTPFAKSTLAVLNAWLREPQRGDGNVLFPSAKGERLNVHGVQYLLTKHRMAAANVCPSLIQKRVTVHRLRHTMAMDLLQAGAASYVIFRSVCAWTFSTMRRILFLDGHRAMRAFQLLAELLCAASNATARVRRESQPLTTANQLG